MPPGAQRMVVNGRPTMRRVVTGHIAEQNNDLAITNFLLAPHGPTTFMAIRDAIQGFFNPTQHYFCLNTALPIRDMLI
jgi:hypothetical protein